MNNKAFNRGGALHFGCYDSNINEKYCSLVITDT
jgi:hypothetical protein